PMSCSTILARGSPFSTSCRTRESRTATSENSVAAKKPFTPIRKNTPITWIAVIERRSLHGNESRRRPGAPRTESSADILTQTKQSQEPPFVAILSGRTAQGENRVAGCSIGRGLATLTLGRQTRLHSRVEVRGLPTRDAERSPAAAREMLRDINDLADVIGVMSDLAVNRLHHGMALAANANGAAEVLVGERGEGVEHDFPCRFPQRQNFGAGLRRLFKLGIAIAGGHLAVGGEKVRPARGHVASQMFHDDRNRIRFWVE